MNSRLYQFLGGDAGPWRVTRADTIAGEPLPAVKRLDIVPGALAGSGSAPTWSLRGMLSNGRYVERAERAELAAVQPALGRREATHAAFIPMSKSAAWWALAQDERRAIFEERSHHIGVSLRYLPAVARGLYHCRDLSEAEPFDFLAWFEYAPAHEPEFDQLLAELRASEEWKYVEREIDIRLVRD